MSRLFVGICLIYLSLEAEEIFRIKWENDLFFLRSDHYYTNGFRFEYWRKQEQKEKKDFQFFRNLSHNVHCENENRGLVLGQNLYTPTEIERYYSKVGDRNYAGWLYLGYLYSLECKNSVFFWEASVGTLGKNSYGEQVQKFVHRISNSEIPVGWSSQVPNTFTLQNHLNYKYFYSSNLGFETSLKLGNVFTSFGMGAMFRFGNIYSKTIPSLDIAESSAPPEFHIGERYFYVRSFYWKQFYDGTLQGGNIYKSDRTQKISEVQQNSYLLDPKKSELKKLFSLDWNMENTFMGRYAVFYHLYRENLPDNLPLNLILFHTLFNGNSRMTIPTKNMILFVLRDKNWDETPTEEKLLYAIAILNDGSVQFSNLLYGLALQYFLQNVVANVPVTPEQIYFFQQVQRNKSTYTKPRSLQGKLQVGFVWTIKEGLFLQFASTVSTPEFYPEPFLPQFHKWAGFQIAARY